MIVGGQTEARSQLSSTIIDYHEPFDQGFRILRSTGERYHADVWRNRLPWRLKLKITLVKSTDLSRRLNFFLGPLIILLISVNLWNMVALHIRARGAYIIITQSMILLT